MRTSRAALKPRCCIASRTAAPCGSSTVSFGVTITFTFIRHYYPANARLEVERHVFRPRPCSQLACVFPLYWLHGRIHPSGPEENFSRTLSTLERIISSFGYIIHYLLHSDVPDTTVRSTAFRLARRPCRAGGGRSCDERAEPASRGEPSGRSSARQVHLRLSSSHAERVDARDEHRPARPDGIALYGRCWTFPGGDRSRQCRV